MALFKFGPNDVFRNRVKTHPRKSFFIYDSKVFYSDSFMSSSLPIVTTRTKDGSLTTFGTVTTTEYNEDFKYGDEITGSNLLFISASIGRNYYAADSARANITALRNTLDFYKPLSPDFAYSSSVADKSIQELTLIDIPSIFYGSEIQKGTVRLKFFTSGTLSGELHDVRQNGELIQIGPSGAVETNASSTAGLCLYKEGFIILTGSWALESISRDYLDDSGNTRKGTWVDFGAGIENSFAQGIIPSSSFLMEFSGTQYIPTVTMLCHAENGQLNYSNNPTFIKDNQDLTSFSGSNIYRQKDDLVAKNMIDSIYADPTGSFEKVTYITTVNVYDEDRNVIGIAKVAKPVKKGEDDSYTFKLKIDL